MEYTELSDLHSDTRVYAQLNWKDISVELPRSKCIIHNSKGYVRPGEFLVIMGPSGSGKTTLLNILSQKDLGKLKITQGSVYLNTHPIQSINYKNTLGFVPQEDILLEVLTPRESIQFAADLTLDIPRPDREQKVEILLEDLGILACADNKIGGRFIRGISGGEKKRTSIGVELISDPPILFLDEPTTGLDSFTAESIIRLINRQAKDYNRTIISTIHQPNSQIFCLFDRLLLLSKGETIYFGRAKHATTYFENLGFAVPKNFNPADHYMNVLSQEMISPDTIDYSINRFTSSSSIQSFPSESEDQTMAVPEPYSKASTSQKWSTLFKRSVFCTLRNPVVIKTKLAKIMIQSLFVIAAFYDLDKDILQLRDRDGALSILVGSTIFEVQMNKALFLREYSCRKYEVMPFFLAYNVINLPFEMIFIIGFISIVYWPLGLNDHASNFMRCMLVLMLVSLTGASLGIMISVIAPNIQAALALTPAFTVPLMLAGGFMVDNDQLGSWFVYKYISPYRYGYEGLIRNEYDNLDGITTKDADSYVSNKHLNESYGEACWILLGISIGIRIIAYYALKFVTRKI